VNSDFFCSSPHRALLQSVPSCLFPPNAHNMLNTYIYHQLPATRFDFCYTIFRGDTALLAKRTMLFAILFGT